MVVMTAWPFSALRRDMLDCCGAARTAMQRKRTTANDKFLTVKLDYFRYAIYPSVCITMICGTVIETHHPQMMVSRLSFLAVKKATVLLEFL